MKVEGHHGLICFILLSILSYFEVSTTTVTIHSVGNLRDTGSVQCGSKVTFICSIPTYTYAMKWLIDSDKVAECVTTNCVQYPPYKVDNIVFSPDTSIGEFNMTINPVTFKADGHKLGCSYGSEGSHLQVAVKVIPTPNTTKIVKSKDEKRKMIRITAITGCVFPSSAVSVQWYQYEEDHKPKLYKISSTTVASKFSVCSGGTCGGNGIVKVSSSLSIPEVKNGNKYNFQVAIRHEDTGGKYIILVNSTRSDKINELSSTVTIYSVGSLRDTGSVQCGSKVTFICSIPTYLYNMVWLIDSDIVAACTTTNCVQYPPYKVDNIEFSPDPSNGEFNMTINQVTVKADGRIIKCRYGSEGVQVKLALKVLPRRNKTEIAETEDDNGNMINLTAITECVFPRSAISMQWYYYEEGHTPRLYNRSSTINASNFSVCSVGSCGGNGVVKLSSTLSLPDTQNGKRYFFQIEIRHKDSGDIILVNTTRSYKIYELPSKIGQEKAPPVGGRELGILLIMAAILVIIATPVAVVVINLIRKLKY